MNTYKKAAMLVFTTDPNEIQLSDRSHTWLIDLDGTIVKHIGGNYENLSDELLPGAKEFLQSIPASDTIIFLTARPSYIKDATETFLKRMGIRYDSIIFDLPEGERILINDEKTDGTITAYALNKKRNDPFNFLYSRAYP